MFFILFFSFIINLSPKYFICFSFILNTSTAFNAENNQHSAYLKVYTTKSKYIAGRWYKTKDTIDTPEHYLVEFTLSFTSQSGPQATEDTMLIDMPKQLAPSLFFEYPITFASPTTTPTKGGGGDSGLPKFISIEAKRLELQLRLEKKRSAEVSCSVSSSSAVADDSVTCVSSTVTAEIVVTPRKKPDISVKGKLFMIKPNLMLFTVFSFAFYFQFFCFLLANDHRNVFLKTTQVYILPFVILLVFIYMLAIIF